jgi:hypothetical protein
MPASKWGRQSRGGLRIQQMAQIDADERDYVSLAALRDGNGDRNPEPGAGDPRLRGDWLGRLPGDARFGKVIARS